jgi:hypothetical protein
MLLHAHAKEEHQAYAIPARTKRSDIKAREGNQDWDGSDRCGAKLAACAPKISALKPRGHAALTTQAAGAERGIDALPTFWRR